MIAAFIMLFAVFVFCISSDKEKVSAVSYGIGMIYQADKLPER